MSGGDFLYFDSHAHYDDGQFDGDRDALLASLPAGGVDHVVDPSQDAATARAAAALAERYPHVYFAAGYHPHEAAAMDEAGYAEIVRLLAHPKCVAVGEIGLDYHYDFSPRDVQNAVFRRMLALAGETGKPAVVHDREATADTLAALRGSPGVRGVVHCYSGSWETARELLAMGWYLSFTGVVTFKNARRVLETVEKIPADRYMIETDAPYMAPEPHRGERNSSLLLPHIARRIAAVRGVDEETVARESRENALRFFGLA